MEEHILERLKKFNQSHIIKVYDKLDEKAKEKIKKQILKIDFELMEKLYEDTQKTVSFEEVKLEPVDYIVEETMGKEEKEELYTLGLDAIKKGEFAVVTMAGGQGTRLGHKGPKGTFNLIEDKSIFEILCEKFKQSYKEYNVYINWYIMTSEENHEDTVSFFEEKNYFGYNKEYISFFKQDKLTMLDMTGKVILKKEASDGHRRSYSQY